MEPITNFTAAIIAMIFAGPIITAFWVLVLVLLLGWARPIGAGFATLALFGVLAFAGHQLAPTNFWLIAFWLVTLIILFYNWGWHCERDDYLGAFVIHALAVCGIAWWWVATTWQLSPGATLLSVLGLLLVYLVAGIPVAIWRWRSHNKTAMENVLNQRVEALERALSWLGSSNSNKRMPPGGMTEQEIKDVLNPFQGKKVNELREMPFDESVIDVVVHFTHMPKQFFLPRVSESKGLVAGWVVAWPGVLIFLLLRDLLQEVVDWVYQRLGTTLAKVQAKVVGNRTDLLK
jgi:hypothetical protein